jgi:hypothetical protein
VTIERIDLGFRPRPWQAECFQSFKRFSVIVVHRRGGKTVMAIMRLVDAALKNAQPLARYAYLAPLLKQAKAVAWDLLKLYARRVPGTIVNEAETYVEFVNGARIRLFGADTPDSLRGLYFDGLVVDEVAQIRPETWGEVLLPTLSDRTGWALFIGTPKGINLFSQLYHKALGDPDWFAAKYDCHTTGVLNPQELAQLQRESTPGQFRQELLCDFTASSDNVLIGIDDAMAASKRHLHRGQYEFAPKVLGVDVAWQGGDRSVIFPRQGLVAFRPVVAHGVPEKTFANQVANAIGKWQPDMTFVDTTGGYGGEVVSRLRDAGYLVAPVVFSWKASEERFANLRAEMYWKVAAWIKEGAAIPPMPELLAELCAPTYSNDNAANRLKLESKDEIRSRLGVSPDLADALALTFAFPVVKVGDGPRGPAKALIDFDPYDLERESASSRSRAMTERDTWPN